MPEWFFRPLLAQIKVATTLARASRVAECRVRGEDKVTAEERGYREAIGAAI